MVYDVDVDSGEPPTNYEDLDLNIDDWPVYLMTNTEPYNTWHESAAQEPSSSFHETDQEASNGNLPIIVEEIRIEIQLKHSERLHVPWGEQYLSCMNADSLSLPL